MVYGLKILLMKEMLIINAVKIEQNQLINSYISVFNEDFEIVKNIVSSKIDISNNEWLIT